MKTKSSDDTLALYMKHLGGLPTLSRAEEARIVERWKGGDAKAGEELVCRSLWHVVFVARRYVSSGEPLEDLIAEGNLALLHALRKFDPSHGTRFGSYARLWIRAYLTRFVRRGRSLVSTPLHEASALLAKIRVERRKLAPTVAPERVDEVVASRLGTTVDEIQSVEQRFSQRDVSFDVPTSDDDMSLHDVIPALSPGPHEVVATHQLLCLLEGAIETAEMPDAERLVVRRRLLSAPGDEPSLAQLARELSVSREWARRLEKRGLARLAGALEAVRRHHEPVLPAVDEAVLRQSA